MFPHFQSGVANVVAGDMETQDHRIQGQTKKAANNKRMTAIFSDNCAFSAMCCPLAPRHKFLRSYTFLFLMGK